MTEKFLFARNEEKGKTDRPQRPESKKRHSSGYKVIDACQKKKKRIPDKRNKGRIQHLFKYLLKGARRKSFGCMKEKDPTKRRSRTFVQGD